MVSEVSIHYRMKECFRQNNGCCLSVCREVASRSAHGLEADVWSLGCMFYTFLVGTPPFDTDTVKTTLNRVIKGEFDLPEDLSPEAEDLIHQLLKKNPTQRIKLHGK